MQKKIVIAVLLTGALWLTGCATTDSQAPGAGDTKAPGAAGTQGLPDSGAAKAGALPAKTEVDSLEWRVHFTFDASTLDEDSRKIVEAHARNLAANPNTKVHLEGHADERGTREYNIALGERRSQSVERLMRVLGVPANRISTATYGEEKPIEAEHDESAWAINRRVEIIYK